MTSAATASSNDKGCSETGRDRGTPADSASFVRRGTGWHSVSVPDDRSACVVVSDCARAPPRRLRDPGMSDTPEFVDFVNRLRALLDREYRRGQDDAARRIMEVARAEVSPSSARRSEATGEGMNGSQTQQPLRSRNSSGHRAPRGIPTALVNRVLRERGSRGAGATEIAEAAESEVEKIVSISGIRFALDRGRAAGRYRNDRGLWFLVEEKNN